jgi:dTDP-4-dehydrorhamnose reductase
MQKKVIVLGGSGMLGSMITDYFSRDPDLEVTATVRTETLAARGAERIPGVNWRLFDANIPDLLDALGMLGAYDWVVNAIGITKPLIHDDNAFEVERAIRINALLPHSIAQRTQESETQVLQIATDCVYSGRKGKYSESDTHDEVDVYGTTKSLGEVHVSHVHHLRCSIIGPEPKEHKFLLDWFLGQPLNASVNGYSNHRWNGVTTLHFAKLCHGIITHNITMPYLQHVIPADMVTKCELVGSFAKNFQRQDVTITPTEAAVVVNRTLGTNNVILNQKLWKAAGYSEVPLVSDMVAELGGYEYRFRDLLGEA